MHSVIYSRSRPITTGGSTVLPLEDFVKINHRCTLHITLKEITENYFCVQIYSRNDVVLTKIHVIWLTPEKHLILAVTSLNSKTKESNLHIYYTLMQMSLCVPSCASFDLQLLKG